MRLLFVILMATPLWAAPTRFEVRDAGQRDTVHFISEAPLERIVGTTSAVVGWLKLDPKNLSKIEGEFEVDLRLLSTGMALRDSHLRDRFLNTALYPVSKMRILKVQSIAEKSLLKGKTVRAKVDAEFFLHGVTAKKTMTLDLTYFRKREKTEKRMRGNLLRIKASFPVDLLKYKVPWTKELSYQLRRKIQVYVHVVGSDSAVPDLHELPTGEKPELGKKKG